MEKLKKEILEQVEESKRPAVKKLLNTLELEAVEEYKKTKFKGRDKKYHIDNETKGILEKYIKRELKTKEVLLVLGISKASFFRMLKEYKGPQVEEPKEIIKKQQEENQEQENYKTCNICKKSKSLKDFVKNGYTKTGIQRYRPTCKECISNS